MYKRLWFVFLILASSSAAYAQTAGIGTSQSDIVNMVSAAIQKSADSLLADCAKWLALFMGVQLILTNLKLLPNADLDSAMAKFVGSIIWFSACWYIMSEGPSFMVLQTSLWVGSTLARTVCKEDVRWTAWSCTGNCLG